MSNAFNIVEEKTVLQQVRENGSARISYKVAGFWSRDSITVYINERNGKWAIEETHSSGGREDEFDNPTATRNFACAMMDAADLMEKWSNLTDLLDDEFEVYKKDIKERYAKRAAEEEITRAAEKERLAKIPRIGKNIAEDIVDTLAVKSRKTGWGCINLQNVHGSKLRIAAKHTGQLRFYKNDKNISRKEMISTVAECVEVKDLSVLTLI